MGAHDRVHRGDRFGVEPGVLRQLRSLVHRAQRVDGGAQPGGEAFVREVLVGEHGVAAVRGDLAGEEQRERRRRGEVRGVGVPGGGDRRGVGHPHHAGVTLDRRHVGMDRDLTPSLRELELVFGLGVRLAADADHEVLVERVVDEREASRRRPVPRGRRR